MNAKITTVNPARDKDFRKASTRFTVYTDGKGRDFAGEVYFHKYDIQNLDFKCRSWGRVAGVACAIEARYAQEAVEAAFGAKVKLVFSQTAGCSCGCSPGFVGTILDGGYPKNAEGVALNRGSVWMDIAITDDDKASIQAVATKCAAKLPKEIEVGNAKVAEEQRKRDEEKRLKEERWAVIDAERAARNARWAAEREQEALDSAML